MCENPRDLTCKRDLDDHSRKDQWACVQFYSSLSWFKKLFCEHSFPSPVFLVFFWVSSWVVAGGHVHLGSGCGSRSHCRHVSRCHQYSQSISRTSSSEKLPYISQMWSAFEFLVKVHCDAPLVLSVNSYPPWEGGICPKERSDHFFCVSLFSDVTILCLHTWWWCPVKLFEPVFGECDDLCSLHKSWELGLSDFLEL